MCVLMCVSRELLVPERAFSKTEETNRGETQIVKKKQCERVSVKKKVVVVTLATLGCLGTSAANHSIQKSDRKPTWQEISPVSQNTDPTNCLVVRRKEREGRWKDKQMERESTHPHSSCISYTHLVFLSGLTKLTTTHTETHTLCLQCLHHKQPPLISQPLWIEAGQ